MRTALLEFGFYCSTKCHQKLQLAQLDERDSHFHLVQNRRRKSILPTQWCGREHKLLMYPHLFDVPSNFLQCLELTCRYWVKWAMLRKMDLDATDFNEMATNWELGQEGKKKLKSIYNNFRGQLFKRLDSALIHWLKNEGKDYDSTRQQPMLDGDELKQVYHNREQFRRIWAPVDIFDDGVWQDSGNAWLKSLQSRAVTYWAHRALSLKTEAPLSTDKKLTW